MFEVGALSVFGVDEKRLMEITKKLNISKKWLYDHYKEIQEKYETHFVAVCGEEIVDSNENRDILLKQLLTRFTNEEVEELLIEYINPKGFILIM